MLGNPSHVTAQLLCFHSGHSGVTGCDGLTPIIGYTRARARAYRGIGRTRHNPSHPSQRGI
jgi:hypothetical protein